MRLKIFMLSIVLVSLFATLVFAESISTGVSSSAQTTNVKAVDSAEALESDVIIAEDVEDVVKEITPKYKKTFSAIFTRGVGSANDGENGFFIYGSWAAATVLKSGISSNDGVRQFRSGGILSIPKFNSRYKLVKTDDDDLDDEVSFHLIPLMVKLDGVDDISGNSVGKFILTRKEKYDGLSRWDGTLVLDSGDNAGAYTVHIDTTTRNVKRISPEVRKNVVKSKRLMDKVRSGEVAIDAKIKNGEVKATITDKEGNSKVIKRNIPKRWWQFWR